MEECTKCDKDGYIYELRQVEGYNYPLEFSKICPCGKHARLNFNNKLNRLGLGEDFKTKTFATYIAKSPELKEIKEKCLEYATNFAKKQFETKNGLYLYGSVGSGKTHLITAISNRLLQNGVNVEYFEYRERMTRLKQIITDDTKYAKEINCKKAKVLFIDDLFKGKISEADINIMYEIINYRYQTHLPTLITSEKTVSEILNIDEAIGSRIVEMSYLIKVNASNHRMKH